MANLVIKAEPIRINVSPTGFLFYSADFLNAYKSHVPEESFSPASYYLLCRSLELSLKAFLLTKGVTKSDIRNRNKFGHHLTKILDKAIELEINSTSPISPNEMQEVRKANDWYARKGFEYFEVRNIFEGKETLPDLNTLLGLAERLVVDLKPACLNAT